MKKAIFTIAISLCTFYLKGQIITQETSPTTIGNVVPGYSEVTTTNTVTISYTPPAHTDEPTPVDGDTTTEWNGVYEYGSVLPANFSLPAGNYTTTSLGKVWTLKISIPNALNVGLTFTNFNLSPIAEMYIYNEALTVIKPGIKKEHFTVSDTISVMSIKGSAIIVYVIERNNFGAFQSNLVIGELVAGFEEIEDVGSVDESGSLQPEFFHQPPTNCIPHVMCFPQHMISARAVARLAARRADGTIAGFCTGTLINSELNNGRPLMLTAFHCVDLNRNGQIDIQELAFLRTRVFFQFQFWRTVCNGTVNNGGIQFNGAELRASHRGSDMALLELINPPGIGDLVNYAGWNRQTTAPSNTQSYVIHHPRGEAMRHTQTVSVGTYPLNSNYWQAYYSDGVVWRASSGSGLFNQNNQIVGQLKAGWSSCNSTAFSDRYGKIDRSWTGGGTNTSRLSNWLSPNQNLVSVTTLNLADTRITGADKLVCNNVEQFSTFAGLLDVTYTWDVTNGLQILSGQGTGSITVSRVQNTTVTAGTITLTLRSPTKGRTRVLVLTHNVTMSTGYNSSDYPINGPSSACSYQSVNFSTNTLPGATSYNWFWPNDWTYVSGQGTPYLDLQSGSTSGSVGVRVATACDAGGSPATKYVQVSDCGFSISATPNPTTGTVSISTVEQKGNFQPKTIPNKIYLIQIVDQMGTVKKRFNFSAGISKTTLNLNDLTPGTYTIQAYDKKIWSYQQLIIAR